MYLLDHSLILMRPGDGEHLRMCRADAVCLDGGSSSAMYYRGKLVRRPGRALTNVIEVRAVPRAPVVKLTSAGGGPALEEAGIVRGPVALQQADTTLGELDPGLYEQAAVLVPIDLRALKDRSERYPIRPLGS